MRITVTSRLALIAYMLWMGVGIAGAAYLRDEARGTALGSVLLAIIAATVHVRIGQTKARERMTNDVGAMIRINELHKSGVTPFERRPGAR